MNRRTGVVVFAASLAARLLLWWSSLPFAASPVTQDSQEYCSLASQLLHFSFPSLVRTPVYPAYLALISLSSPPPCANLNAIFLAQCILDSVTAILVARATWIFFKTDRAALFAGLTWAISPVAAVATTFVMTETLFMFLIAVALNIALTARGIVGGLVEGLTWTAVTLTRPSGVLLPVIVISFLLIRNWREWPRRFVPVIIYALVIGAWVGHNYKRSGEAVIATIDVTSIYTFEVAAVKMLDEFGPSRYARMWIFDGSGSEKVRDQFQQKFTDEIRSRNPSLPSSLYVGWEDLSVVRPIRDEMRRQLDGRIGARAFTHIVGVVQTIRPVLHWPRGGWWMTALEILRLIFIALGMFALVRNRQWWMLAFALAWTAYALLLPGVCGLWRFRSTAEVVWGVVIGAVTSREARFRGFA